MSYIQNALVKLRGRAALAGKWQTAVVVVFFSGIGTILTGLVQGNALNSVDLYVLMQAVMRGGTEAYDMLEAAVTPHVTWILASYLLNVLITPSLTLGSISYFLKIQRGGSPAFVELFSQFRYFFRNLWLYFLIGLRVALWSLLFSIPATLLLLFASSPFLGQLFIWGGVIASVIATLRYMQAAYFYVDAPEAGALQAIRESKLVMKGRIGQAFLLGLSFIGWELLCNLPTTLIANYAVGYIISMFALQFLAAYRGSSFAAYYMALRGEAMVRPRPEQEMHDNPFAKPDDDESDDKQGNPFM